MKNHVVISLDDLYNGKVRRIDYDKEKGVSADFAIGTSKIVRFIFSGDGDWTEDSARKWMKNRKLNKVYFRRLKDGRIWFNQVCLSAHINQIKNSADSSEVKDLFGGATYDRIMEVENRHGSDKPFVVKVVAMDFKGKDFVVANGIKYYRKTATEMIDQFASLAIRLGHRDYFDSYNKRVGNTVGAYVDSNKNPVSYTYIYPHGEAGEFRENLMLADAQGQLDSYEVSMFGDPIDYETVQDDKVEKEDGARVLLHKWKPTSLDYVDEGAIDGSAAFEIANSNSDEEYDDYHTITITGNEEGGSKVTITEILQELEKQEKIALSDFLSIKAFEDAIDNHIKLSLARQKEELLSDPEFATKVIEKCGEETISKSERVGKIVNSKLAEKNDAIDKAIEDVATIAKKNKIELSKDQMFMVKNNLTGDQTEEEILEFVKAASKFTVGLSGISGIFQAPDDKKLENSKVRELHGASIEEIAPDQITSDI